MMKTWTELSDSGFVKIVKKIERKNNGNESIQLSNRENWPLKAIYALFLHFDKSSVVSKS